MRLLNGIPPRYNLVSGCHLRLDSQGGSGKKPCLGRPEREPASLVVFEALEVVWQCEPFSCEAVGSDEWTGHCK